MATFHVRVEGLTGIAIDGSSSPTEDELTEYLKDGVIDVTNRWILVRPDDTENFLRATSSDSQGVEIGRAKIVAVMREAGADGSSDGSTAWRSCNKIPPSFQSRVVDVDSLDYASKYHPVFAIEDTGVVNVYPVPSSNNGIKVFYVNNTPVNGSGSSLAHSHDDIKYFPSDKIYLVVLYASIRCLDNALAARDALSDLTISSTAPNPPALSSTSVSFSATAPTYQSPIMGELDYSDANTWINTEEDETMVQARVQVQTVQLQEHKQKIEDSLNTFNEENTLYQAELKESLKNADLESNDDIQKIQNYQAEIASYQQKVQSEVQEYAQSLSKSVKAYEWMYYRRNELKKEYDTAFGIARPQEEKQDRRRRRRTA